MVSGKVDHNLIDDGYQIASDGPVVWTKFNALRSSFDRRAAGKVNVWVVPEQRHVGHFASGGQVSRDVVGLSHHPKAGDAIHVRNLSGLPMESFRQALRLVGRRIRLE